MQIGFKAAADASKKERGKEDKQSVVIRKRPTLEPDLDHNEQQIQFLDEVFGEQSQIEEAIDRASLALKRDEARNFGKGIKKNKYSIRKPDFKE